MKQTKEDVSQKKREKKFHIHVKRKLVQVVSLNIIPTLFYFCIFFSDRLFMGDFKQIYRCNLPNAIQIVTRVQIKWKEMKIK